MVPFLYLIYASTEASLSAQTVVAHATSLGVAFVTSAIGTWRYARAHAISWKPAIVYAVPGIAAAFLVTRVLTRVESAHWVRAGFGVFLLGSAWDMARQALRAPVSEDIRRHPHSWFWLAGIGVVGGGLSASLGIGGGLIAVPVLLYIGRLPIRTVAPTALAGVCLTTLSGALGYLTAGAGPLVSRTMVGFVDLRMALPLCLGAAVTVPLGVRVNRTVSASTLYRMFAAIFTAIGLAVLWSWYRTAQ
jgi:uncharacterized membrane protein YfcA